MKIGDPGKTSRRGFLKFLSAGAVVAATSSLSNMAVADEISLSSLIGKVAPGEGADQARLRSALAEEAAKDTVRAREQLQYLKDGNAFIVAGKPIGPNGNEDYVFEDMLTNEYVMTVSPAKIGKIPLLDNATSILASVKERQEKFLPKDCYNAKDDGTVIEFDEPNIKSQCTLSRREQLKDMASRGRSLRGPSPTR